jgi:hypothetical protein
MYDSAQANFNVVRIVYGLEDPSFPMVDNVMTYLFHLTTNMDIDIEKINAKEFSNECL